MTPSPSDAAPDREPGLAPDLDLDAVLARAAVVYAATTAADAGCPTCLLAGRDVPQLVHEVRRLRGEPARS